MFNGGLDPEISNNVCRYCTRTNTKDWNIRRQHLEPITRILEMEVCDYPHTPYDNIIKYFTIHDPESISTKQTTEPQKEKLAGTYQPQSQNTSLGPNFSLTEHNPNPAR